MRFTPFTALLCLASTAAPALAAAAAPRSPSPATSPDTTPSGTTSDTAPIPAAAALTCSGTRTKFKHFGVSESCAEFASNNVPGVLGTDYTWPSPSSIDGFNTFRIPFLMERLSPPSRGLTGSFDTTYLNGLKTIVNYITNKGGYAAIDPHNYMIYNGHTITSTSDFTTWWKNLASQFKSNTHVIFDVMNEPHDIPASTVFNMMQAAVNAIRSSGATSQLILVSGTSWTGAWTWNSSGNGAVFGAIKDPNNNVAIEMHQYFDSDGGGGTPNCVSNTIGSERLAAATAWLKEHNLKGFLGEIGGGSNSVCINAIYGALCSMQQAGGVWIGALWWAAGPWWGSSFGSMEPPNGAAIPSILPQAFKPFL